MRIIKPLIVLILILSFACTPPVFATDFTDQVAQKGESELIDLYKKTAALLFAKWYLIAISMLIALILIFTPVPDFIRFFAIRYLLITTFGIMIFIAAPAIIENILSELN